MEIDGVNSVYHKPIVRTEEKPKPVVKPQVQTSNADSKRGELNFAASNARLKLEKNLRANAPQPSAALEAIKRLPKPDSTDSGAVADYKKQIKTIADNAIKNSHPPRREDYNPLPPKLAYLEYGEASNAYNSQISELKKYSADATAHPKDILTPGQAAIEIENLRRPDRNNPDSIKDYNQKRADIADRGLLYAEPPKREDFKGLNNPRLADYEYREAKAGYDRTVRDLTDLSYERYSSSAPPINDAEADQAAQNLINKNSGATNEDQAYGVGKDVAALAKTNPDDAAAIMKKVQDKLAKTEYGDNVASGFVNNSSVEELRAFSLAANGQATLDNLKSHLLSGDIHDSEKEQAAKIDLASTGFDVNTLDDFNGANAQTIDKQLQSLPPQTREKYLRAAFDTDQARNALNYAAEMSPEGRKALGETLSAMYDKDPQGTIKLIESASSGTSYGPHSRSGMANAIASSGNENLIKNYAKAEIERGNSILKEGDDINNEAGKAYLNAMSVYGGLSPQSLQSVMQSDPKTFNEVLDKAISTEIDLSTQIYDSETGLGSLLKTASQIRGADGKLTSEAINLFEKIGTNPSLGAGAKEGAGAFFIENAQQLVDKYTDPLNPGTPGSEVLEKFFGSVVYAPNSKDLTYNGGSLTDAIMGDENGTGGVIGSVVDNYLQQANAVAGDDTKDNQVGQRIGFLWSSLSDGFLKGVDNYKDEWNDQKKFRDFTFDMLGKGLGKIADKVGLPGQVVEIPLGAAQKIYESRAENDRKEQLQKFVAAFSTLNNTMFTNLNNYENVHSNVKGLHDGFVGAYNWQSVQTLFAKLIED